MHRTTLNRANGSDRNAQDQRAERAAVMLTTERAFLAPLGALRIAIEGARSQRAALPDTFLDRALEAVEEASHAASDMMAWANPRPLRPVACSVLELVASLRLTLSPELDSRCHFLVEGADTPLFLDGRLIVDGLERSIRRRLAHARRPGTAELMVHAHVENGLTTVSLIDASEGDELDVTGEALSQGAEALAEAILTRDCERIGGRVSIHETGGHRCIVAVFPADCRRQANGQEASA